LKNFNGDEARAVEYADHVVRITQATGNVQDLSSIQRGTELQRLFTMFYTFFNMMYSLTARRVDILARDRSPSSILAAANTALMVWFVPSVLSEMLAGRGPDEDEEPIGWAAAQMAVYPFLGVVGVRDFASAVESGFGYQISPAQSAPVSLWRWIQQVQRALDDEKEVDARRLVRSSVQAAGYATSLPLQQPLITVGNLWDYWTGEDPEFYVRDLFFTKPKSRRH